MNGTIRELLSGLKRQFREQYADSRLPNKLVWSLFLKNAKILIYREDQKLALMNNPAYFQPYDCVDVIEVTSTDKSCGLRTSCTIQRTRHRLPDIFMGQGPIIYRVSSVDMNNTMELDPTTPGRVENDLNNPFIKKNTLRKKYYFSDGYLYFPFGTWRKIKIQALFEEDLSIKKDCSCGTVVGCKRFLDGKVTVPEHLIQPAIQMTIQELAGTFERIPEKSFKIDKTENTK